MLLDGLQRDSGTALQASPDHSSRRQGQRQMVHTAPASMQLFGQNLATVGTKTAVAHNVLQPATSQERGSMSADAEAAEAEASRKVGELPSEHCRQMVQLSTKVHLARQ